jgi:hypothetical protein
MVKQNLSKINRQPRNLSLAPRVAKKDGFMLPTGCGKAFMKT